MTIGWFDAFRENGAPTWYGENRTPVVMDLHMAALLSIFITPTIAYILILPGIRRYATVSTVTFMFSMIVGTILLGSIYYPCWQQGEARVLTTYKAFSTQRMNAVLGVKIGLYNVNITLSSKTSPKLDYNDRMGFDNNIEETERALIKGMPYPMLKVVEYLSMDRAGFNHGRQYRMAGYYTGVLLWCAFACWILQMVLLCVLPQKFGHLCITVGFFAVTADVVYALNVPALLFIPYPSPNGDLSLLEFKLSHCFWATLIAGIASILFGIFLLLLQQQKEFVFRTMFATKMFYDKTPTKPSEDITTSSSCSSTASIPCSSRSSCSGDETFNSQASTTSADRFSRVMDDRQDQELQSYRPTESYENRDLEKCRSVSQVHRMRPGAYDKFMDNTEVPNWI